MGQCSVCSRPISGMDVLYTREGELICPHCDALRDLHEADVRAAKNIPKAALSCFLFALLSYVINPWFMVTGASISSGLYALKSLAPSNHRFSQHIASQKIFIILGALLGLAIAGFRVILHFVPIAARF
jgi:hypothetical protein